MGFGGFPGAGDGGLKHFVCGGAQIGGSGCGLWHCVWRGMSIRHSREQGVSGIALKEHRA